METKNFRTKTYHIERKNGGELPAWVIGLDMGYSSVKTIAPNAVSMFPSFAQPDHTGGGLVGSVSDSYIRYTNLKTGAKWLIGEAAQDNISDNDTSVSEAALYGRERYNNEMFSVLIDAGLGRSLIGNQYGAKRPDQEIYVVTGLPPKYLDMDSELLRDAISGEHNFSLRFGKKEPMNFHFHIKPENVNIMSQPMGTLFAVSYGEGGYTPQAMSYLSKNVMIFDIGFGTADFFPVKNHVITGSETFPNFGMRAILKATCDAIREQYQVEISVPALQKYLKDGEFKKFDQRNRSSKRIPFGSILEDCSKQICKQALDMLFQVYPMHEFDYLVLTGGTAKAWTDLIREDLKEMDTLTIVSGGDNDIVPAELANARGYYWYGYNRFLSKMPRQTRGGEEH